jgi:hypothetical protein
MLLQRLALRAALASALLHHPKPRSRKHRTDPLRSPHTKPGAGDLTPGG